MIKASIVRYLKKHWHWTILEMCYLSSGPDYFIPARIRQMILESEKRKKYRLSDWSRDFIKDGQKEIQN